MSSLFIQPSPTFRFFAHAHTPILVSTNLPGCRCPPNSFGIPPTHPLALCHYHHPSLINTKSIFHGNPCQNRHTSDFFFFFLSFFDLFFPLGLFPPPPLPPPTLPLLRPHLSPP